ncbi:DNase I-like protein [Punctularia strigosozonata HHB-11173 SS5]|uniref:DNase I-like protein n=1 Tax=Punctularia strigosozonata (strain HHB-11173) TaxID=741275 RepID=UPI0004417E5D|nr:DNase I-like protein [Punctularia strigosozonata HHB-11173 SS5]EIN14588.1 DNase I-like protein [Punctularia strigosozonata HHB-11173 SS5]
MEDAAREVLRDSEVLKVTLQAYATPTSDDGSPPTPAGDLKDKDRRVLAVISHQYFGEDEQGAFLVLKPPTGSTLAPRVVSVEHVFPIVGRFSITMAQGSQQLVGFGTSATLNQPKTDLFVTITPDGSSPPLTLLTHDLTQLRALLAEYKRLKEIADSAPTSTAVTTYSWLAPYTARQHSPTPPFSSKSPPPDLRVVTQPLHTRLSKASAGDPGDDAGDIAIIREDWLRTRAREACAQEQDAESRRTTYRLRLGTFNVNGKLPSQDLAGWVGGRRGVGSGFLPPVPTVSPLDVGLDKVLGAETQSGSGTEDDKKSSLSSETETAVAAPPNEDFAKEETDAVAVASPVKEEESDPDFLVLGFQELDLSTGALVYATDTTREDSWVAAVLAGLGEKAELYEKLASKQLVGMLIIVMVKKRLRPSVIDVKTCSVGAGIMGLMGNKGATAVRITLAPLLSDSTSVPTVLTFVNAHLAAFDEMVDRRNADFHDLSRRLVFNGAWNPSSSQYTEAYSVFESDCLFWMVDLNYRIDLPDQDLRNILGSAARDIYLDSVQRFDQLKIAITKSKAFVGFSEHQIAHLPTYRFAPGVMTDKMGYDMKRKPAWCDRILTIVEPTVSFEQLSYASHPEISQSDHKPVSAEFIIKCDNHRTDGYDRVLGRLYKTVYDFEEFEEPPKLKVSETSVDLGKVRYNRPATRSIQVRNVGKQPCAFRFVAADPHESLHPKWLKIEPLAALLLPEETCEVSITCRVDRTTAESLTTAPELACTLILHTELGKDHFVLLTGEYERTCFGNSLKTLTRLPGPIRSLESKDLLPEEKANNAPREPMRLANWLMDHASWIVDHKEHVQKLFLSDTAEDILVSIRDCLDTGDEFPLMPDIETPDTTHILAFGEALKQMLDSLSEPVIPWQFHERCAQILDRDMAIDCLSELPAASVNVWISVTSLLHFISQQGDDPAARANELAAIFSNILLRDDSSYQYTPISPWKKRDFLMLFIRP